LHPRDILTLEAPAVEPLRTRLASIVQNLEEVGFVRAKPTTGGARAPPKFRIFASPSTPALPPTTYRPPPSSHIPLARYDMSMPAADIHSSSLYNEDLAPVPQDRRSWGTYNYAALWIGMSVCIPTYTLASSFIKGGMSWWQAIGTILLGNLIVLVPMLLNAHAGTRYGIPFPVFVRPLACSAPTSRPSVEPSSHAASSASRHGSEGRRSMPWRKSYGRPSPTPALPHGSVSSSFGR
jgi:hypothetical protein